MPNIEWVGTPNYTKGRGGHLIIAIINHITAGKYPGCLSWMQNPASKASCHYLILKDGRILQLVKDEDTAWHAGAVNKPSWKYYDGTNPNRYTLGIEHEGYPEEGLTEKQYQSTLWLHQQLVEKWGIPVDSDHIIGHYRIDSVNRSNCPGPKFPWSRLFSDLKGGGKKTMDYLVLCNSGVDERAAGYLSDYLKCPVANLKMVSKETIAAVSKKIFIVGTNETVDGANCEVVNISTANRYETCQAVLDLIKKGVK